MVSLHDGGFCFFLVVFRRPFQHHFAFGVQGDQDRVAVVEFAAQQPVGERILHLLLDDTAQGAGAEFGVVAQVGKNTRAWGI